VLFLPDQFLGAHAQRATKRKNMHVRMGECQEFTLDPPKGIVWLRWLMNQPN